MAGRDAIAATPSACNCDTGSLPGPHWPWCPKSEAYQKQHTTPGTDQAAAKAFFVGVIKAAEAEPAETAADPDNVGHLKALLNAARAYLALQQTLEAAAEHLADNDVSGAELILQTALARKEPS